MQAPAPPQIIAEDELACVAWRNAFAVVSSQDWAPPFEAMMGVLAACAARYCREASAIAAGERRRPADIAETALLRWETRKFMAGFEIIKETKINIAEIRPDGLDKDIAALCEIGAHARP